MDDLSGNSVSQGAAPEEHKTLLFFQKKFLSML